MYADISSFFFFFVHVEVLLYPEKREGHDKQHILKPCKFHQNCMLGDLNLNQQDSKGIKFLCLITFTCKTINLLNSCMMYYLHHITQSIYYIHALCSICM